MISFKPKCFSLKHSGRIHRTLDINFVEDKHG
jgi:hypothetical protein